MTSRTELTVIGGGPAGLAAAVEAAGSGLSTTIIDAAPRFGGQYWRHGPAGAAADRDLHHDLDTFDELCRRAADLIAAGHLTHLAQHHVWALDSTADGCRVQALDQTDPAAPRPVTVTSELLVLATGAHDRPLPFPGWDLPGVLTVGGAQSLLKGSGVAVGPRVLIAGTGPFLLPVAAGLARRGVRVLGVHEANHPAAWLRHRSVLTGAGHQLIQGAGYAATLARHRVPVRNRSVVLAAHGTDRVQAVTLARVDAAGAVRHDTARRVEVDVLAVGYGFTVQAELPTAAGCRLRTSADGTAAVATDADQRTSNPRVFAAGETTGVGGAPLAVAEGLLAGAAAARSAGHPVDGTRVADATRTRDRLRRFADAMHDVYPVPAGWLSSLTPDTVVCRCEEVTVADVDLAVRLGARDGRTAKLMSRAGMGWCQGRECSYSTACLVADRTGTPPELLTGTERRIATPVPLGVVAGLDRPPGSSTNPPYTPDSTTQPEQGES